MLVGAQVDEEFREQLMALARKEDRSLASLIRRALARALELAEEEA